MAEALLEEEAEAVATEACGTARWAAFRSGAVLVAAEAVSAAVVSAEADLVALAAEVLAAAAPAVRGNLRPLPS